MSGKAKCSRARAQQDDSHLSLPTEKRFMLKQFTECEICLDTFYEDNLTDNFLLDHEVLQVVPEFSCSR